MVGGKRNRNRERRRGLVNKKIDVVRIGMEENSWKKKRGSSEREVEGAEARNGIKIGEGRRGEVARETEGEEYGERQ